MLIILYYFLLCHIIADYVIFYYVLLHSLCYVMIFCNILYFHYSISWHIILYFISSDEDLLAPCLSPVHSVSCPLVHLSALYLTSLTL